MMCPYTCYSELCCSPLPRGWSVLPLVKHNQRNILRRSNMISSVLKWVGGAVIAVCMALPTSFWLNINSLERPVYKVSKTICLDGIKAELREYEPYLIAESMATGDTMRDATSKGFRNVAGYIFGDNYGSQLSEDGRMEPQKVAMTAPVRTEQPQKVPMTSPVRTELRENVRDMTVSFMMPRKYTPETLPRPKNRGVKIKRVGAHRMVAIRFRGRSPDEAKVARVSRDLYRALERESLKPKGKLMVYQYHPPFMPGFLRRNEVAVQV